MISKKIFNLLK